jgi:hypothetical protein
VLDIFAQQSIMMLGVRFTFALRKLPLCCWQCQHMQRSAAALLPTHAMLALQLFRQGVHSCASAAGIKYAGGGTMCRAADVGMHGVLSCIAASSSTGCAMRLCSS